MLGSGRPFLVEVQNARLVPSLESVKDLQTKINNLQNKLVRSLPTLLCFFLLSMNNYRIVHYEAGWCEKFETSGQSVMGSHA